MANLGEKKTDPVEVIIRAMAPVDMSAPFDRAGCAGKTILITGGASGLGAAFAREWASHGAHVFVGDVDERAGEALVASLRASTGSPHHHFQRCDVTDWASQVALFRACVRASPTGGIDVVVPNAGIGGLGEEDRGAGAGSFEDPRGLDVENPPKPSLKVLDVNLTGVMYTVHLGLFWLARNDIKGGGGGGHDGGQPQANGDETPEELAARLKKLRAQRDRHLLLIGSIGGVMPLVGAPEYTASKHGVTALFRTLRTPCFWRGIRVNMLLPCFVDTPMVSNEVMFVLAGSGKAAVADVVEAGTRFVADKMVAGRAVVVGPRLKVDDGEDGRARIAQLSPAENEAAAKAGLRGQWPGNQAAWECYAHDYENLEGFVYRYNKLMTTYAQMSGWLGWARDVLSLFFRNPTAKK
ncbi:hypothetical protein RB595_001864 [Gaeumannomyces hyphopodioides]